MDVHKAKTVITHAIEEKQRDLAAYQAIFDAIHAGMEAQERLKQLEARQESLKEDIAALDEQKKQRQELLDSLGTQLVSEKAVLQEKLKQARETHDAKKAQLDSVIENKQAEVERLDRRLSGINGEIERREAFNMRIREQGKKLLEEMEAQGT